MILFAIFQLFDLLIVMQDTQLLFITHMAVANKRMAVMNVIITVIRAINSLDRPPRPPPIIRISYINYLLKKKSNFFLITIRYTICKLGY